MGEIVQLVFVFVFLFVACAVAGFVWGIVESSTSQGAALLWGGLFEFSPGAAAVAAVVVGLILGGWALAGVLRESPRAEPVRRWWALRKARARHAGLPPVPSRQRDLYRLLRDTPPEQLLDLAWACLQDIWSEKAFEASELDKGSPTQVWFRVEEVEWRWLTAVAIRLHLEELDLQHQAEHGGRPWWVFRFAALDALGSAVRSITLPMDELECVVPPAVVDQIRDGAARPGGDTSLWAFLATEDGIRAFEEWAADPRISQMFGELLAEAEAEYEAQTKASSEQ